MSESPKVLPLPVVPDALLRELMAIDEGARLLAKAADVALRHAKGRPSAHAIVDLMSAARTVLEGWALRETPGIIGWAVTFDEAIALLRDSLREVERRYIDGAQP